MKPVRTTIVKEFQVLKAPDTRYNTQFQKGYKGRPCPVLDDESMTTPDMHMTIAELLMNHTRGMGTGAAYRHGEYFDTEIPVFYDLVDQLEYKKELAEKIKEAEKAYKAAETAKKKKEIEDSVRAEIAKEKKREEAQKGKIKSPQSEDGD